MNRSFTLIILYCKLTRLLIGNYFNKYLIYKDLSSLIKAGKFQDARQKARKITQVYVYSDK